MITAAWSIPSEFLGMSSAREQKGCLQTMTPKQQVVSALISFHIHTVVLWCDQWFQSKGPASIYCLIFLKQAYHLVNSFKGATIVGSADPRPLQFTQS